MVLQFPVLCILHGDLPSAQTGTELDPDTDISLFWGGSVLPPNFSVF